MPTDREKARAAAPISAGVPRRILKARRKRAARNIVYSIRAQVVIRADGCCEKCGLPCRNSGEAHHKIHRSQGGTWTLENIEFLCRGCHGTQHGVRR